MLVSADRSPPPSAMSLSRLRLVALAASSAALALAAASAADGANRYVAPNGSDARSCTSSAPCRSLNRAYRVARPGDTVIVRGGSYGSQTIALDPRKARSTRKVVFRPATGARVSLSYLSVAARRVGLRSMKTNGWYVRPGARYVTLSRIHSHGPVFITSASNISVVGGQVEHVGSRASSDSQIKASNTSGAPSPRKILIRGVNFHHWARTSNGHIECLQIGAADGITLRNNRFSGCATHDIFINSFGGTMVVRNLVIENNFFGQTLDGFYSLSIRAGTSGNILVRNNSAVQGMYIDPARNTRVFSNLAPASSGFCRSGIVFRSNVWRGARCHSSDRNVASLGFINGRVLNLHLLPRAAAINRGYRASYPSRDIDGQRRPRGGAPDAGADER